MISLSKMGLSKDHRQAWRVLEAGISGKTLPGLRSQIRTVLAAVAWSDGMERFVDFQHHRRHHHHHHQQQQQSQGLKKRAFCSVFFK